MNILRNRNIFMRRFGSDDSWDVLLVCVWGGGGLLKLSLFRGGLVIFFSPDRGGVMKF